MFFVLLYNILITAAFIAISPYLLYRLISQKKYREGFRERFGLIRSEKIARCKNATVWFHAVSVGEASAIYPLYQAFKERYSKSSVIFSTTTATGQAWIRSRLLHADDVAIYFPIDLYWVVKRLLNRFRPGLFISAETEIWPNFWWGADLRGMKLALVNGRVSNRSFRGYSKIIFFLKHVLDRLSFIAVQTEEDARKFIALGAPAGRTTVSGNLKFEISLSERETSLQKEDLKKELGIGEEFVLMGGSTHAGEEKILLGSYLNIREMFPGLRLILAPRHPERFTEVKNLIEEMGFRCFLASEGGGPPLEGLPSAGPLSAGQKWNVEEILLVNVMGDLQRYYSLATIVFVGKSLTAHGGQNLLEPAALGKVILFGPHMENFREIADLFLRAKAATEVCDPAMLEREIKRYLSSEILRRLSESRARELVQKNKGALARTLEQIEEQFACQA